MRRKHVVRELKDLDLKLVELGITNGAILEVKMGRAHEAGKCELTIAFIRLLQEKET